MELKNGIEELKHKHDLEIKTWKEKLGELNSKYQAQSKSLLDFKEKVEQLSDANVSEQQKYKNAIKDLNGELEQTQYLNLGAEKQREQLELENLRLTTANQKLTESLDETRTENRRLLKERGKLVKEIKQLEKPTEFDKLLGKPFIFASELNK